MTIQAQLADGRILEFPDGTDPQVIQDTVKSQITASQPQPEVQNDLSATEQIIGGVSGAATLASDIGGTIVGGLTALVDVMNPFTDNDPSQMIQRIQDKLRIDPTVGGEAALNQMGEIIESSGAGSLIKSVKDFSDKAGQEGLDITGSPAFATFVNIIPDIIAEVGGAGLGKRLAKSSAISPITSQAKKSALSTVSKADKLTGITQLTSDVLPPNTRLGKLLQSQGELVAGFQRKGQQGQRVKAVENLVNKFDVAEGVGFEAKIVKGLKDSIQSSKKAIGELYDESATKLDQLGNVPLSKTKKFAQDIIDRELKKGTKANQSVIDDMQSFVDAPDDLSFELVKEIRTGVGANLEKVKRGAPVQGNTDTGLLKRTYAQLTNDMTGFAESANPALAAGWKKANDVVSEFATGTSKQGAKSIIKNGDATPEVVDSLLFSNKNSDLEFLSSNLDVAGKQAAKQRVLQRVLEKSSIDGDDINPNKFLTQLNKNRNQIGKMFEPEERKAIFALRDQLSKTRRAQDASIATPTGQQLTLGAAIALPQALIPGVIQGLVESKPIRNLLIKRKAAKTAKSRAIIDVNLQNKINELGLTGALVAPTQQQENK
tara:strand:+ start:823 stop:2628 length:1806 start_codon:yes stop_codon:yes gene_type:complete